MSKFIEPQILITERATATASSIVRRLYNTLEDEYDDNIGGDFTYADATVDSAISFGTITKGKLFILSSDQDVSLKLNGSVTAMPAMRFFLMVADETIGITSATISNASGSSASIEMLIAGDVTT